VENDNHCGHNVDPRQTTETETVTETTEQLPSIYIAGEYIGTAICYPDAYEDFYPYTLTVTVCIENDQIVSITDAEGFGSDYDTLNDVYIQRAMDGTKKFPGIAVQILTEQTTEGIDAVSGATCSSDALLTAVQDALQQALRGGGIRIHAACILDETVQLCISSWHFACLSKCSAKPNTERNHFFLDC